MNRLRHVVPSVVALLSALLLASPVDASTPVREKQEHHIDLPGVDPASILFGNFNGINTDGDVVGYYQMEGTGIREPFLLTNGELVHLDETTESSWGEALDVNNRQQVVGHARIAETLAQRAFLWAGGTIRDLGTLGGSLSEAHAINDRGQVVGWSFDGQSRRRAFLWEDGQMRDLGVGDEEVGAIATDINDRGQIVGYTHGANAVPLEGFLWENGRVTWLGTLGEDGYSDARAINNRGQIVGSSSTDFARVAYMWERGEMQVLGGLRIDPEEVFNEYDFSIPYDINDRGEIVGYGRIPGDEWGVSAIVWHRGFVRALGTPNGLAYALNESGQVIGRSGGNPFAVWK